MAPPRELARWSFARDEIIVAIAIAEVSEAIGAPFVRGDEFGRGLFSVADDLRREPSEVEIDEAALFGRVPGDKMNVSGGIVRREASAIVDEREDALLLWDGAKDSLKIARLFIEGAHPSKRDEADERDDQKERVVSDARELLCCALALRPIPDERKGGQEEERETLIKQRGIHRIMRDRKKINEKEN